MRTNLEIIHALELSGLIGSLVHVVCLFLGSPWSVLLVPLVKSRALCQPRKSIDDNPSNLSLWGESCIRTCREGHDEI